MGDQAIARPVPALQQYLLGATAGLEVWPLLF